MNIDELMRQMEADEREDQRLITPVEYGRLRGIAPQRVYYYIRNKKLIPERCECGRNCVVKAEADELFGFADLETTSEVAQEEEEP